MSETVGFFPPAVADDPVRLALDSLREGFQIIGFDWRYVYVNPAAARHGRRDPADLIGRPMWDAYPGIASTPLFDVLRACMTDRSTRLLENQFTFPDGTQRWFELRVQAVPAGICVYSSDIDARKRRELERDAGLSPRIFDRLRRLLGI